MLQVFIYFSYEQRSLHSSCSDSGMEKLLSGWKKFKNEIPGNSSIDTAILEG